MSVSHEHFFLCYWNKKDRRRVCAIQAASAGGFFCFCGEGKRGNGYKRRFTPLCGLFAFGKGFILPCSLKSLVGQYRATKKQNKKLFSFRKGKRQRRFFLIRVSFYFFLFLYKVRGFEKRHLVRGKKTNGAGKKDI